MRITASHLVDWVATHAKEAQENLPRLIRRLSFDPSLTKQLAFPSGDSTFVPGWDGVTCTVDGNAWVPSGDARWEIGCDADIQSKANRDYKKRTKETETIVKKESTFIFVTPRRWTRKANWVVEKCAEGHWNDVRAYDADDLEQWLEQTPTISLQFAEEIGLSGWGVMSPSKYWKYWSQQSTPPISPSAFIGDRSKTLDNLKEGITGFLSSDNTSQSITIRADSVDEASAFASVAVLELKEATDACIVISEPQGWRFVETNSQARIAIATNAEVARNAIVRDDLLVIFPHSLGDLTEKPQGHEIVLERPDIYEFEKALISLGMEESDAKRFAASSGRSWTIFRRQQSINPALKNPPWLASAFFSSLSVLCLVNAWNERNGEDRKIVERISGQSYENVEKELNQLAVQDDAPVLHIGNVWKAKSALELFSIMGGKVSSEQFDRFFDVAKEMLSTPDPQLELPEEERWMAQIHGKTHPYSGLLFQSVCESLMKLGARGAGIQAGGLDIDARVYRFVEELFEEADEIRWLSLASYLPTLAEAAPDVFLNAVESSIASEELSVTRLIKETGGSGLMGRCWHSGLLWALEKLAWSPRMLARVALVLAQLTYIPIKGNWGNTPISSLHGIFRSWLPQTAADIDGRIEVLDLVIEKFPDVAYELLERLLERGPQMASPADRPGWRDDDAGAGRSVTIAENENMLVAAKDRMFAMAANHAPRIAILMKNTIFRKHEVLHDVLQLLDPFLDEEANDNDREILRASLRNIIHWHRNYDDSDQADLDGWLVPLESYYEKLVPKNTLMKYRWLFDNHWVELPIRDRGDDYQERQDILMQERKSAISEIYEQASVRGLEELIDSCAEPHTVGQATSQISLDNNSWSDWMIEHGEELHEGSKLSLFLSGYLRYLPEGEYYELLECVLKHEWDHEALARLFVLGRIERKTWDIMKACGDEVSRSYWKLVAPYHWVEDNDMEFVIDQLLLVERPLAAMHCCQHEPDKVSPELIFKLLQGVLSSGEKDGPRIDSWHIGEMLQYLESSEEIDREALVQLEFAIFPALRHGDEEKAELLFEAITSEPSLFNELIRLVFKPEHGEAEEASEASRMAAETAWNILNSCKRIPGTEDSGKIDESKLQDYVDTVRTQGRADDRLRVCDASLGEILAHCNSDNDGYWPPIAIAKLLDQSELDEMRKGFSIGVYNKRGVTSRSPNEGGGKERKLARYYREHAARVQHRFPNVSSMLDGLARTYEKQGRQEDAEAGLRKEVF